MLVLLKRVTWISLLTFVFIIDDVLIYLLLKNLFRWQVNVFLLGTGTTVVLGFNLLLAILVYKALRKRPTTGQEGLIGTIGVAKSRIAPEGQIEVRGELWKAESPETIEAGQKVVVEEVHGLRLVVKKLS
ncbi:MAG: NfeD family protein [bacterium]